MRRCGSAWCAVTSNAYRLVQEVVLVCVGGVFVVFFWRSHGGLVFYDVYCVGTGIFVDCFFCARAFA